MLTVFSYAKINIFLHIISKRKDDYHDIFTLMSKIGLHDTVSIEESKEFSIDINTKEIPNNSDNIVWKIYGIVKSRYDIPPVRFHIYKKIPWGAGLGGGSSNAEAALRLMDQYFNIKLTDDEKKSILQSVGSDTVFFMSKSSSAYAEGRGEIITDGPYLPKANILLIKPAFSISTKEAYQGVKLRLTNNYIKDKINSFLDYGRLIEILENDFENTIFVKYQELKWIKDMLLKLGADGALMSGSGSTIFGLFSNYNRMMDTKRYFDRFTKFFTAITTIL